MLKKIILFSFFLTIFFQGFNQEIPSVNLLNIEENVFNTSLFNKNDNKIIVLSFWATWCIPCLNELSVINDNIDNWQKNTPFTFYAVSTDDSRTTKRVEALANGKNWTFPILLDRNQDFKRLLNIPSVPYTLVIKNGKIVYKHVGYVEGDENELFKIIKSNQ